MAKGAVAISTGLRMGGSIGKGPSLSIGSREGGPRISLGTPDAKFASAFSGRSLVNAARPSLDIHKPMTPTVGPKEALRGDKLRTRTVNGLSPDNTSPARVAVKSTSQLERRTTFGNVRGFNQQFNPAEHLKPNNIFVPDTAPRGLKIGENRRVVVKRGERYSPEQPRAQEQIPARRVTVGPERQSVGDKQSFTPKTENNPARIAVVRKELSQLQSKTDAKHFTISVKPEISSLPGVEILADRTKQPDKLRKNSGKFALRLALARQQKKGDDATETEKKTKHTFRKVSLEELTELANKQQKKITDALKKVKIVSKSKSSTKKDVQPEPLRIIQEADRTLSQQKVTLQSTENNSAAIARQINLLGQQAEQAEQVATQRMQKATPLRTQSESTSIADIDEQTPPERKPNKRMVFKLDVGAAMVRINEIVRRIEASGKSADPNEFIDGSSVASQIVFGAGANSEIIRYSGNKGDGSKRPTIAEIASKGRFARSEARSIARTVVYQKPPVALGIGIAVKPEDVSRVLQGETPIAQ